METLPADPGELFMSSIADTAIEEGACFHVEHFGVADYQTVWQLQKERVESRLRGDTQDTLLMGEHLPVLTTGRRTHPQNLLNTDIALIEVERGGDVTYHGPGQLIAYPIFLLPEGRRDLHQYLRNLEASIILTLADFGICGVRHPGWTGVWVRSPEDNRLLKIASIGVAVKRWVTYHGLALNVSTDLDAFRSINPCGLESQVMTSMENVLKETITMDAVKTALIGSLKTIMTA